MASEPYYCMMDQFTTAALLIALLMGRDAIPTPTLLTTRVASMITLHMDWAFTVTKSKSTCTRENGLPINRMERAHRPFGLALTMRVNFAMGRRRVLVNMFLHLVHLMKVSSKEECSGVRERSPGKIIVAIVEVGKQG
jgi:hypothetical protein